MRENQQKKLTLSKETLSSLESLAMLRNVGGAYNTNPKTDDCNKDSFWPECYLTHPCPIWI